MLLDRPRADVHLHSGQWGLVRTSTCPLRLDTATDCRNTGVRASTTNFDAVASRRDRRAFQVPIVRIAERPWPSPRARHRHLVFGRASPPGVVPPVRCPLEEKSPDTAQPVLRRATATHVGTVDHVVPSPTRDLDHEVPAALARRHRVACHRQRRIDPRPHHLIHTLGQTPKVSWGPSRCRALHLTDADEDRAAVDGFERGVLSDR